jgi:GH24 family phage-related lysozyme (muramidase)
VTEPAAAAVLAKDLLTKYGPCVDRSVKAPLNNNQYSALVSFAYNAGCGALDSVAKNTGLNVATGRNYNAVPTNMQKYNKGI